MLRKSSLTFYSKTISLSKLEPGPVIGTDSFFWRILWLFILGGTISGGALDLPCLATGSADAALMGSSIGETGANLVCVMLLLFKPPLADAVPPLAAVLPPLAAILPPLATLPDEDPTCDC